MELESFSGSPTFREDLHEGRHSQEEVREPSRGCGRVEWICAGGLESGPDTLPSLVRSLNAYKMGTCYGPGTVLGAG